MAGTETVDQLVRRVMNEIKEDCGLTLSDVGMLFPGHRGKPGVNSSTVFRWVTVGIPTSDSEDSPVKLEAVRVGQRWVTSHAAVERFVAILTARGGGAGHEEE